MTVVEVVAIALAIGVGIGGGVRWLMRNRTHLSFSAAVLAGMIGSAIGAGAVSVIAGIMRAGEDSGDAEPFYEQDFPTPVVLLTILAAILFTFLVLLIATRISREPDLSAAELVVAGETAEVEFKSSARYNQHTGQRDPKLELVIAKTIAAFANSAGGVLLIGVADDGSVLGLDNDYKFMKKPDNDRYELWLRDHLSVTLGADTAAAVRVDFPSVSGSEICEIRVSRSDRPIFVTPTKGKAPELWVRVGNSTRELSIDQAFAYGARQWGRRQLRRVG